MLIQVAGLQHRAACAAEEALRPDTEPGPHHRASLGVTGSKYSFACCAAMPQDTQQMPQLHWPKGSCIGGRHSMQCRPRHQLLSLCIDATAAQDHGKSCAYTL